MKILLADADNDLRDLTVSALEQEDFEVIAASDGEQALERWREDQPDVVVLETDLPCRSGFDVCRQIRASGTTPVVLISTWGADESIVRGLALGADDYVMKPFSPRVLALRIRAAWHRTTGLRARVAEPTGDLRVGEIVLDRGAYEVRQANKAVRLTPLELRLLELLASNAGRVISASRLVDYAWSHRQGQVDITGLKVHISHLRKKLQRVCGGQVEIRAVPGVGYTLLQMTQ